MSTILNAEMLNSLRESVNKPLLNAENIVQHEEKSQENFRIKFDKLENDLIKPLVQDVNEELGLKGLTLRVYPTIQQRRDKEVNDNVITIYLSPKNSLKKPSGYIFLEGNPYDESLRIGLSGSTSFGNTYNISQLDNNTSKENLVGDFMEKVKVLINSSGAV